MRLLLDTHIAIWFVTKPAHIGREAFDLIMNSQNKKFVSVGSIWEIAIKHPLNKRNGAVPFSAHEAIQTFQQSGFALLDITPAHAAAVETLPLHHADPFDRLLVAQALSEPMRLITADAMVARYSDTIILMEPAAGQ